MALYKEVLHPIGNIKALVKVNVHEGYVYCPICNDWNNGIIEDDEFSVKSECHCDIDEYVEKCELEDAEQKVEELEEDIEDYVNRCIDLKDELHALKNMYEELQAKYDDSIEAVIEEYEQKIAVRDDIIDELEEQLAETREE